MFPSSLVGRTERQAWFRLSVSTGFFFGAFTGGGTSGGSIARQGRRETTKEGRKKAEVVVGRNRKGLGRGSGWNIFKRSLCMTLSCYVEIVACNGWEKIDHDRYIKQEARKERTGLKKRKRRDGDICRSTSSKMLQTQNVETE